MTSSHSTDILRPEILAPAGNADMLRAAVYAGADAVYLGLLQFNARRTAGNFSAAALEQAVAFCHARNVRVYVTLNTLAYPGELPALAGAVADIAAAGPDAVIVQDLAAAALVRRMAPSIALHGSTQMSVHSPAGARQLAQMGFSRVILARELSLGEIAAIARAGRDAGIETECFVHGALCMSVSGQCYMSAFFGGRSANRGVCAGPCRLPFAADGQGGPAACHLSLKDHSHIAHLPALAKAGVCSVKIEGRLKGPEYVAAAVDACRRARAGEPYDEELLQNVFSRSGFTDGYLTGRAGAGLFGVRTAADAAAARQAMPRLRALYRRERSAVPVDMALSLSREGVCLAVRDKDGRAAEARDGTLAVPAEKDQGEAVRRALEKTGGTPFYLDGLTVSGQGYVPASVLNGLRREALEKLLALRQAPAPAPRTGYAYVPPAPARPARQGWLARFENADQVPPAAWRQAGGPALEGLFLPAGQWRQVPAAARAATWLELPRAMFPAGEEERLARTIEEAAGQGFAGFVAQNLAHFRLLAGTGAPVFGGFGLNVTNPLAAEGYKALGAAALTAGFECRADELPAIAGAGLPLAAFGWGHVPLMLTRACPLQNVRGCAGCPGGGFLADRKGLRLPVRCTAPGFAGVRTVHNAVPLYVGDRAARLPARWLLAWFTVESAGQAADILDMALAGRPLDGPLTRGLYWKERNE